MASALQSAIQSVRSATYLRSLESGKSNNSKGSKGLHSRVAKRNGSTASNIAMVRSRPEQRANVTEAYALEGPTNTLPEDHDTAQNGIWVNTTFGLNNSVV